MIKMYLNFHLLYVNTKTSLDNRYLYSTNNMSYKSVPHLYILQLLTWQQLILFYLFTACLQVKKSPAERVPPKGTHRNGSNRKGPTEMGPPKGSHRKGPNERVPPKGSHQKGPTERVPPKGSQRKGPTERVPPKGSHRKGPGSLVLLYQYAISDIYVGAVLLKKLKAFILGTLDFIWKYLCKTWQPRVEYVIRVWLNKCVT